MSYAFRSLDQSYHYEGFSSGSAWTAGSGYVQPPVEESVAELRAKVDAENQKQQRDQQAQMDRKEKKNKKDRKGEKKNKDERPSV